MCVFADTPSWSCRWIRTARFLWKSETAASSSATFSHFQLLHWLQSSSPTSAFPSCPLSLFHFPPAVEPAVKATCSKADFESLSFSILKMFSDKKRVETALEQCGVINNRVNSPGQLVPAGQLSIQCAFPCSYMISVTTSGLSPWGLVEHSSHFCLCKRPQAFSSVHWATIIFLWLFGF